MIRTRNLNVGTHTHDSSRSCEKALVSATSVQIDIEHKLPVASAPLLVTRALLLVTRSYTRAVHYC